MQRRSWIMLVMVTALLLPLLPLPSSAEGMPTLGDQIVGRACLPLVLGRPAATPTPTRTATATITATPTRTATATLTPTPTRTSTSVPTATRTRTLAPTATSAPVGGTVYITDTGTKYHRLGCRYLGQSSHPVSCSWATSHGYSPCGVCHPSCP